MKFEINLECIKCVHDYLSLHPDASDIEISNYIKFDIVEVSKSRKVLNFFRIEDIVKTHEQQNIH